MEKKVILLVDDEQVFLEALVDALVYEGFTVLKATTGEEAMHILESARVDLVTLDIMMPPGTSFESATSSQKTGIYLCKEIRRRFPNLDIFCLSVVSDPQTIREIQGEGVRFLKKGETPLRTVIGMIKSRITGIAYTTRNN